MNDAPLLQVSGLSRAFGGVRAVDGVDFSLGAGELRCLIGPNGAGKSTFFKCLTGQLKPTAGDILFSGRDLIGLQTHEIARLGIGVKTQVPSVFGGLSVAENLALAARRERDEGLVDQLGIAAILERRVDHLPHGQRQLVELAMVLATEPRLILLDEPTAGLTREEVERVAGLIQSLEHRCATIVVEHDMQFVRAIARTVTVFHQGRTLVEGSVHDIMNNADVRAVYLGKRSDRMGP